MAMIDDRDLMVIDPSVFVEALAVATVVIEAADGLITNDRLTSMTTDFEAAEIDAGHVVVVSGVVHEVVSRISSATLSISRPRANTDDPIIKPEPGSSLPVQIPTFARQTEVAQAWVFGALGLDPEEGEGGADATAILNPAAVGRLIAAETLSRVFRMAATADPTSASLADRAVFHREQTSAVRRQTRAVLDLNGDGSADCTRRVGVAALRRG